MVPYSSSSRRIDLRFWVRFAKKISGGSARLRPHLISNFPAVSACDEKHLAHLPAFTFWTSTKSTDSGILFFSFSVQNVQTSWSCYNRRYSHRLTWKSEESNPRLDGIDK